MPPVFEKPESSQARLVELFTNSFLTKTIDSKNHLILARAMYNRNFTPNQNIIRHGEMGSEYFVLGKG